MELELGYQQTEVGVIPEDWSVVKLGEFTLKIGSGITPTGGATVYKQFGRPFMRSQNVGWGILRLSDIAFIDDQTHNTFSETELKKNDVLLNITGASIGRCALATSDVAGGNVNQHVCIIRTKEQLLNPAYLSRVLLSDIGQRQIDSFQAGGNREGLNFGQIRSFNIPLPPTKTEQTAIANALSDADALIQSLASLIAKKRQIKQGAMQTLLNPYENGRLKEGWIVRTLEEIIESTQLGGNYANSDMETDFPLIKMGNLGRGSINLGKIEFIKPGRVVSERDRLKKGDVLFNTRNTLELVGKVAIWLDELPKAYFNSNIMRLKFIKNLVSSNAYINFMLNQKRQIQQLRGIATGTTSVAAFIPET